MITEDDVKNLNEGDLVEFRQDNWTPDTWIRTRLIALGNSLMMRATGNTWEIRRAGQVVNIIPLTIKLIEKVPVPYYSNHHRDRPVDGDIAKNGHGSRLHRIDDEWIYENGGMLITSEKLTLVYDAIKNEVVI